MSVSAIASGNAVRTAPVQQFPQERAEDRAAARERAMDSLPGRGDIGAAAADMEQISQTFNRRLKFTVDHQSHEVTVKVIDPATDKVIRILPPEELQRLHNRIRETIGLLFDERV